MESITFSVRLTREEYITFAAKRARRAWWTTAVGAVLLAVTAVAWFFENEKTDILFLAELLGLIGITLEAVWLPLFRSGEAARRFDEIDTLKQASTVVLCKDSVTVRSSTEEGTLPLSLMSDVITTDTMTALVFGKELTVYIPTRALTPDEAKQVNKWIMKK